MIRRFPSIKAYDGLSSIWKPVLRSQPTPEVRELLFGAAGMFGFSEAPPRGGTAESLPLRLTSEPGGRVERVRLSSKTLVAARLARSKLRADSCLVTRLYKSIAKSMLPSRSACSARL